MASSSCSSSSGEIIEKQFIDFSELDFNKNKIDIVLYHKNCTDGVASAAVIEYYRTRANTSFTSWIDYIPMSYGETPPDVIGKNVVICDFSFKKDILLDMISKANSLIILDHHKTAEADLKDIESKHKIFDMNYSGAMITWLYMFDNALPPRFIRYVQDRDLWQKRIPGSEEFALYALSLNCNISKFVECFDDEHVEKAVKLGSGMLTMSKINIDRILRNSELKFVRFSNGETYLVAYVDSCIYMSELGNELINKYPNADFSVVSRKSNNIYYHSLRSSDDRLDVTNIAKLYNGGGHRNASGCSSNNFYIGNIICDGFIVDNCLNSKLHVHLIQQDDELKNIGEHILYAVNSSVYQTEIMRYMVNKYNASCIIYNIDYSNYANKSVKHKIYFGNIIAINFFDQCKKMDDEKGMKLKIEHFDILNPTNTSHALIIRIPEPQDCSCAPGHVDERLRTEMDFSTHMPLFF